jgi:hypothetical protein
MPDEYEWSSSRYEAPFRWAPKDKMAVFSNTAHMALIKLYSLMEIIKGKVKGKAILVTGCGSLYTCKTSRLPHFLDNQLTDGSEVASLMRRPC